MFEDLWGPYGSVRGMRVIEAPVYPKMQLGEAVKEFLTPEQIADHNKWLLEFFGTTSVVPLGTAYAFNNCIMMRPEDAVKIVNIG